MAPEQGLTTQATFPSFCHTSHVTRLFQLALRPVLLRVAPPPHMYICAWFSCRAGEARRGNNSKRGKDTAPAHKLPREQNAEGGCRDDDGGSVCFVSLEQFCGFNLGTSLQ